MSNCGYEMSALIKQCFVLFAVILAPCAAATASAKECFTKTLTFQAYEIKVSSSPGTSSFSGNPCFGQAYRLDIANDGHLVAKSEVVETDWIENALVTDLNGDGSFEVLVNTVNGMGSFGDMELFTLADVDKIITKSLPPLSKEQESGYRGKDDFAIEGGQIIRTFPTYVRSDANCCPSGQDRRIQYEYEDGELAEVRPWTAFSFRSIAIAFVAMLAANGLWVLFVKRRLRSGELAAVTIALLAAIYCIAAGFHLQPGWHEMIAANPEESSGSGGNYGRRGGIIILAILYWPYVLIGLGGYFGYHNFRTFRDLLGELRRSKVAARSINDSKAVTKSF